MTGRESGWLDSGLPDSEALRDIIEDYLDTETHYRKLVDLPPEKTDDGEIVFPGRWLPYSEVDALRSAIGLYRVQKSVADSTMPFGERLERLRAAREAVNQAPDLAHLAPMVERIWAGMSHTKGRPQISKTTARDNLLRSLAELLGFATATTEATNCCNSVLRALGERPISAATLRPIIKSVRTQT